MLVDFDFSAPDAKRDIDAIKPRVARIVAGRIVEVPEAVTPQRYTSKGTANYDLALLFICFSLLFLISVTLLP